MDNIKKAICYAGVGDASKWWVAALGGFVAWLFLKLGGWQVTSSTWLPSDPFLANTIVLLVCVIAGEVVVFSGRLAWAPFHFMIETHGGLNRFLQKQSDGMALPIILIVSGVLFCILLVGAGLLLLLNSRTYVPTTQQIANIQAPLKSQLSLANATIARLTPKPAPPRAPVRYTAYEKEQRLRAVDEIYTFLTSNVFPIFSEGQGLLRNFQDPNQGINDSTRQKLLEHAQKVKGAFGDLSALFHKYEYYPDIIQAAKTQTSFNGLLEENASENLAEEINFWNIMLKSEGVNRRDVWNRDTILQEFATANGTFQTFLEQALPNLKVKRAEIEAAAVYSDR